MNPEILKHRESLRSNPHTRNTINISFNIILRTHVNLNSISVFFPSCFETKFIWIFLVFSRATYAAHC